MPEYRLLSDSLIRDLDNALAEGVSDVEEEDAAKVQVGVTFAIAKDEEGDTIVQFVHKSTQTVKGEFRPGPVGQLRLLSGVSGDVTFAREPVGVGKK